MKRIISIALLGLVLFFISCDKKKAEKKEIERLKQVTETTEKRINALENAKDDIREDIIVLDSIIDSI